MAEYRLSNANVSFPTKIVHYLDIRTKKYKFGTNEKDIGQNAPHYSLDKLSPARVLKSQKVGRETNYINNELIEVLKK